MVDFWQSQEVTSGAVQVPPLTAGHKGLFFDRLDAGALTWAGDGYVETHPYAPLATLGGLGQGEVSQPYLIGHARNRTLHTLLGKWNQRDPFKTGSLLVEELASYGVALDHVSQPAHCCLPLADGPNLYAYVRSDPMRMSDPVGLFSIGDVAVTSALSASTFVMPGPSDIIRSSLSALVSDYSENLSFDVHWAADFGYDDDWHSRTDNTWISYALMRGLYESFNISLPGTEWSANPLDLVAGRKSGGGSGGAGRRGGETSATIKGKKEHAKYYKRFAKGWAPNLEIPGTGLRPDAINVKRKSIRELKPNTPSGRARMSSRLNKYIKAANETYGCCFKGIPDYYAP